MMRRTVGLQSCGQTLDTYNKSSDMLAGSYAEIVVIQTSFGGVRCSSTVIFDLSWHSRRHSLSQQNNVRVPLEGCRTSAYFVHYINITC